MCCIAVQNADVTVVMDKGMVSLCVCVCCGVELVVCVSFLSLFRLWMPAVVYEGGGSKRCMGYLCIHAHTS